MKKIIATSLIFLVACTSEKQEKLNPDSQIELSSIVKNADKVRIDFEILRDGVVAPDYIDDGEFIVYEDPHKVSEILPRENCSFKKTTRKTNKIANLSENQNIEDFRYFSYIKTAQGEIYYIHKNKILHNGKLYTTGNFSFEDYLSDGCSEKGRNPY